MMNFPTPTFIGQQFNNGATLYAWDGVTWNIVPQMQPVYISDTPPPNPAVGQEWWRSTNGQLYIWFVDAGGPPGQWVQSAGGTGSKEEPYPFSVANMSLLSGALGAINANNKADGTGTNGRVWTSLDTPFSFSGSGYQKFPTGLIVQWGTAQSTNTDYNLAFPTAFPSACLSVVGWASVAGTGSNTLYAALTSSISRTAFDIRTRQLVNGGSVGAVANCPVPWIAVGF